MDVSWNGVISEMKMTGANWALFKSCYLLLRAVEIAGGGGEHNIIFLSLALSLLLSLYLTLSYST